MENLKNRAVQINSGGTTRLGEVIGDRGEQVAVWFPPIDSVDDSEVKYFAKWRLLTSEYLFCDVPSAMGVYLIAKPFVEECA
jgi:hypothetical protein